VTPFVAKWAPPSQKTAWEIGCILNLSQRTVEWHIEEACKRLGAANRLQAIAMLGASLTMF
jgi:DNA-binding CsgD family transcriptional regulator